MRSLCPYVTIVMPTKPAVLTQSIAAKPSPKPFVSKITSCHGNIVYTFLIFRRLHHKTCGSSSRCEDEDGVYGEWGGICNVYVCVGRVGVY